MPDDTLYLVWFEAGNDDATRPLDTAADARRLARGLWLVRSGLSRSRLYHAVKRRLPAGRALLVAPLEDAPEGRPKFKGMAPGAAAWLRDGRQ